MISAKLMASSTPGIAKAKSCIMLPIMPFWSAVQTPNVSCQRQANVAARLTLLDHLLYRACGVDLHSVQVVEAIDLGRLLGELLAKRI